MKYIMITEVNEVVKMDYEPTLEEVRDSMALFLSVEIVRGDEVMIRRAEVVESGEEEGEKEEIEWVLIA